jgi:naphthoate synthase/2-ketocyclohexanecarboxyl-CoA hydrolase
MSEWSEWEPVEDFESEVIVFEKRYRTRGGGVARLSIDRPEKLNALNGPAFSGLVHGLGVANRDAGIGVIVITHKGPHFGVGGDLTGGVNAAMTQLDPTIKSCKKPVIAAVRGYCIGASNHMAYTCDFTVAGESTVFGQNGPRIGSPASGYLVANAAHVMGMKRGREMWMRCRHLSAQEGLESGLCNVVVQDRLVDDEVEKICDDVLDLVPTCIATIKQSFEAIDLPLHYSDRFIGMMHGNHFAAPDVREGGRAFMEKRKPNHWTKEMIAWRE